MHTSGHPPSVATRSLADRIRCGDPNSVKDYLESITPTESARVILRLDADLRVELLSLLDPEDAAGIMRDMPTTESADMVENLSLEQAAPILEEMQSDLQADILNEVRDDRAEAILQVMKSERAEEIRKLKAKES